MGSVIGYQEAHGPVATFETDVAGKIKNLVVDINPVQSGTGDPSPDNIRPITGWTGAKVTKCGKNLFDPSILLVQSNIYSVNDDGSITVKAGNTSAWDFLPEIILPPGIYTISRDKNVGNTTVRDITANAGIAYMGNDSAYNSSTFTVIEGHVIKIRLASGAPTYPITVSIQIERGSTATEYEPYVGSTYDIAFPSAAGTVYGGTLDVVKGELMVDRAMVDMGTVAWGKTSSVSSVSGNVFMLVLSTIGMATRERYAPNTMLSSAFATAPDDRWFVNTMLDNEMFSNQTTLFVSASQYDTPADFKAAMNGVQLCYELATPITYQLTPQEINTIIGTNTIYADTGDTSVIYPKTITPVETVSNVNLMELRRGIIASQPHLETISGTSLSFKSAVKEPESLIVNIEPIQSGTGNPSPDNIRPISGRTKATVTINGTDIEINFPSSAGTVYGGWLDLLGGELVVDRVLWENNTNNMNNSETYPGWNPANIRQYFGDDVGSEYYNQKINIGTVFAINTRYQKGKRNDILFLPPYAYNNLNQSNLKSLALDVQIIIPLSNSITYQLDPITIELLKGDNTITADCGDTTITYWTN